MARPGEVVVHVVNDFNITFIDLKTNGHICKRRWPFCPVVGLEVGIVGSGEKAHSGEVVRVQAMDMNDGHLSVSVWLRLRDE